MLRSFIPFLLAGLGFILFGLVIGMPLFEWQIRPIEAGSSSTCDDRVPSSLTTKLGESLDLRGAEGPAFVVKSSQSGRIVEGITRSVNRNIFPFLWLLLFVCGMYTGWYAFHQKRPIAEILLFPSAAFILACMLINAGRVFYPFLGSLWCLHGRFHAELTGIHYETLLVLLAAFLAAAGALLVMLRQIKHAITQRKEAA